VPAWQVQALPIQITGKRKCAFALARPRQAGADTIQNSATLKFPDQSPDMEPKAASNHMLNNASLGCK
jgi:hypothetical protein